MFFDIEKRTLYAPVIEGFNAFSNELYVSVKNDNTFNNASLFGITYIDLIKNYPEIEKLCCSHKNDEGISFLLPSSESFARFFAELYYQRQL